MLTVLGIIYAIACVLLVIVVMLQSGKSGGMGLFGGSGSSTLGSQGGDIMTRITTILGTIFLVVAILFTIIVSRDNTASRLDKQNKASQSGFVPGVTNVQSKTNQVVATPATNVAKP
jgi:preprotein translocase subunit SecG